ncbi:MAG: pyridoxal phosphate-dependent decarboxylase family protein [Crocinitomicaceae bacterium]
MRKSLEIFNQITDDLLKDEKTNPVSTHIPSAELFDRLDVTLNAHPMDDEDFAQVLKELIFATPRTATNAFFNQLFGGRNGKAILGDLLAVIMNNSMYTYKAAGPMVGVEKTILRNVCNMIGWGDNADGTFGTGGSMTNFMSMLMARDAFSEKIRLKGVKEKMTVYTSKESHYSIPKNAAFSGIGRENVRYVPTDKYGKLIPDELERMIKEDLSAGYHPVLVNATAGTTVLGAFDPIRPLAKICKAHNIWLHVDGAYCGSVLFSEKYKHLIDGIEEVDSFSFNAHKMLGTPLTCSIIVTKDKKYLYDSFSNDASYLYQTDHDEFNLGKTSLQCGRRNDALKFWTLWKSVGTKGLEAMVDHQFHLADVALDYITKNKDYKVYSYLDSISICFNYKDIPARNICTALYESSELLVGYGSFDGEEFIRLVTINVQNSAEEIMQFFEQMEAYVDKNEVALRADIIA